MTDISPVTPAEQLKNKKQIFEITLDKYKQCLKKFATTQDDNDKGACVTFERQLNNIINHDMILLQNNISTDIKKMNNNIKKSASGIDHSKEIFSKYDNIFPQMKMDNTIFPKMLKNQFIGDNWMASEPHKYELFQVKIWKFIILAYYFFGIIALMYFFKKHGQPFNFSNKLGNAIYNFRQIFTIFTS